MTSEESGDKKRDRFEKVAVRRAQNGIDQIAKLARCSNRALYDFDESDVERIFAAIESQVERTRDEFERVLRGRGEPVTVTLVDPED